MNSQQTFGSDSFPDSDELLSWFLLNPEMADFDNTPSCFSNPDIFASSFLNDMPVKDENNENMNGGGDYSSFDMSSTTSGSQSGTKRKEKRDSPNDKKSSKTGKKRQRGEEDIENRVNELRAENADLQAHLLNVTQRTTEVQKQRTEMEKRMHAKLMEIGERDDSDQSELAELVKEYTDIYADYGKCRQREVAFHVNQLEKLIVPTLTTKMCLWALQQDTGFFQRSKSPMYDMLSTALEITAEQSEKIQERREKIKRLLTQLNESLSLLGSFKTAIERKHTSYDNVCGRVQAAATPKQVVQFQLWITRNAQWLSRYIPDFSRSVHHTPNVEFIPSAPGAVPSDGAHFSNSSSSSNSGSSAQASLPAHGMFASGGNNIGASSGHQQQYNPAQPHPNGAHAQASYGMNGSGGGGAYFPAPYAGLPFAASSSSSSPPPAPFLPSLYSDTYNYPTGGL